MLRRPRRGLDLRALDDALDSPDDPHVAPVGLVTLENTHARSGGVALGVERTRAILAVVRRRGVRVHVDGARLFNAAAALGVAPQALVEGAESVQICLSKGLGAPAGSVLAGSRDVVAEARRVRKMLGGGMRQAGVLAAMGLVALANAPRLEDDHARAARLAGLLRDLAGETRVARSPRPPRRSRGCICRDGARFEVDQPPSMISPFTPTGSASRSASVGLLRAGSMGEP